MERGKVLLRLDDGRGFLPEGVIACPNLSPTGEAPEPGCWISFITIQLGASGDEATYGLLHFFELSTQSLVTLRLDERPGAVIPTDQTNVFLVPMGQGAALIKVKLLRRDDGSWIASYVRLHTAVLPNPRPGELANDAFGLGIFAPWT